MRYVQEKDGVFIRHIHDVEPTQWDENNYCFAHRLEPERAAMLGVSKLQIVTPPFFNPATQKRVEKDALLVDGIWTQVYAVEELDEEERQTSAAEQTRSVRQQRDKKLKDSDWTQVIDAPVDQAAWAAYRQALRDVTSQTGFPWTIEWPVAP
jgi:hypothetical protein